MLNQTQEFFFGSGHLIMLHMNQYLIEFPTVL